MSKKNHNSCGCKSNVCCPHQDSTEGLCKSCQKIPEKCICKKNKSIKKWKWQCLICEKEIQFDPGAPGDDHEGLLPCLEGGTLDIHFGWFSKFDQLEDMMSQEDIRIQGAICDDCFKDRESLTRRVEVRETRRYIRFGNRRNK